MSVELLMEEASRAYYDGKPFITNEEYDALERLHGQMISGSGDIQHVYRMYSLKKHYDKDGDLPLKESECVKTPKLDGAAVDVTYVNGELQVMLTRGDGIKGRDITDKAKHLQIPKEIKSAHTILMVTGEVVAHKSLENSRNQASGALNLKDEEDFIRRVLDGRMQFVAYGVQYETDSSGVLDTYEEDMELLKSQGFNVITKGNQRYIEGKGTVTTLWEDDYPTDGIVYRINCNNTYNSLGWTDKFPRGAIAYKKEQEAHVTILLDVVWQTGKSGKVTPVAILEPVIIGEAEVARATLNNIAYIEALDLEIGCKVEVIRSGEIIPCIVGRYYDD